MNDLPSGSFPNYNHDKYGDNPGQLWNADDQCRILLRDTNAYSWYTGSTDLEVKSSIYRILAQINVFL